MTAVLEPQIIMRKKSKRKSSVEKQRSLVERERRLEARIKEFDYLLRQFAKTYIPKAHNGKEVLRYLRQYESLYRYMAYTQMQNPWTFEEHYQFCKEIMETWNVGDIKEMLHLCCRNMNLTPFKVFCKLVVDDAQEYCRLYESMKNQIKDKEVS